MDKLKDDNEATKENFTSHLLGPLLVTRVRRILLLVLGCDVLLLDLG